MTRVDKMLKSVSGELVLIDQYNRSPGVKAPLDDAQADFHEARTVEDREHAEHASKCKSRRKRKERFNPQSPIHRHD